MCLEEKNQERTLTLVFQEMLLYIIKQQKGTNDFLLFLIKKKNLEWCSASSFSHAVALGLKSYT